MRGEFLMNLKSLGQHYLEDRRYLLTLLKSADLKKKDIVLEIGAGDGRVTKKIAQQAKRVISYEIDKSTYKELQEIQKQYPNIDIHFENFLKVEKICKINKIISSLPYQITEPFIEKIISIPCQSITLIVGATFAKNITSNLFQTKLSLLTNCFFRVDKICDIPKTAFSPPPKTISSIIKLFPKSKDELVQKKGLYIMREVFEQRDKKLKNALREAVIRFYNEHNILITKRKSKMMLNEYFLMLRRKDITIEQMTNQEISDLYKFVCSIQILDDFP